MRFSSKLKLVPAVVLIASAVLLAACASMGRGAADLDSLTGAIDAGRPNEVTAALKGGAASSLNGTERASLFQHAYDRAKSAYDDFDARSAEFRDLLEIMWRLDGEDGRYLYLATLYAYLTGQHVEVVRLGHRALDTPMRSRVAYMLAESHRALGDAGSARTYYELVLSENLVGFEDVRARCRARLEELR